MFTEYRSADKSTPEAGTHDEAMSAIRHQITVLADMRKAERLSQSQHYDAMTRIDQSVDALDASIRSLWASITALTTLSTR